MSVRDLKCACVCARASLLFLPLPFEQGMSNYTLCSREREGQAWVTGAGRQAEVTSRGEGGREKEREKVESDTMRETFF